MRTWSERVEKLDIADKPLTRALLNKAATDLSVMESVHGLSVEPCDALMDMIGVAVAADIFVLLFPSLAKGPDALVESPFPRDRVLTFVAGLWFLGAVVPRLREEGCPVDINNLTRQVGVFLFMDYDEMNREGLVKIGVQYWKELSSQPPASVVEWDRAFSQMVFIHYEEMSNDQIDLGDFDLNASIGKMLTVFLSFAFALPPS